MKNIRIKDQDLIRQFVAGKDSSSEILLNRYKDRVFSYIVFTVKDEDLANDIFQDTFIKVVKTLKKGKYNDEGKFLPWVMRIAHNLIIDYFRKTNRIPLVRDTEENDLLNRIDSGDMNVERGMIKGQIHRDVKELIKFLPKEQKQVLIMRIYCEMSFKEIAEKSNVSINTALGRMRYALINLRKMIQEKELIINY
ncbi:MAG TPA: RNA polymerase subunit sigma-24 [Flavobacteriales bacterium]|nr:RNA polymerase subunit sigma-24 [Flavobacteriales bacterium]